jgi:hypothetical protein
MRKSKVILALAVGALLGACGSCKGNKQWRDLAIGYKVLAASKTFGESVDKGIKTGLLSQKAKCLKKYQPKTPAFAGCISKMLKVSQTWTGEVRGKKTGKGVLPLLQAAQKSTRLSLDTAVDYMVELEKKEKACKDDPECLKKVNAWQTALKGAVCAVLPVVDAALKAGAKGLTDDPTYKIVVGLVKGFTCPKGG